MPDALTLDTGLPAGNVGLLKLDGDDVWFSPELRDTAGDWFYWAFRVRNAGGRRLRFHGLREDGSASAIPLLTTRGPAISNDCGRTWRWQGPGVATGDTFQYTFQPAENDVWFATGMVYTQSHWRAFTATPGHGAKPTSLTHAGNLPVEALRAGCFESPARRVLVTARHHACEMMASYALEGMVRALSGTEEGRCLAADTEFLFVPFMDVGGVARGDQGKNRRPHDHHMDYTARPLYPEVAALQHTARYWGRGRLAAAFDLHCPFIRGGRNERLFQVRGSRCGEAQARFGNALERLQQAGVDYAATDDMPWGEAWNTATETCSEWMADPRGGGAPLATLLEIPYADAKGAEMTITRCRALGADFVRALAAVMPL